METNSNSMIVEIEAPSQQFSLEQSLAASSLQDQICFQSGYKPDGPSTSRYEATESDDHLDGNISECEEATEESMGVFRGHDEKIEKICAICIEEMKEPSSIQKCQHSFCTKCLILYLIHRYQEYEEKFSTGDGSFVPDVCPYCRGEFDFKDLPLFYEKFSDAKF